MLINIFFSFDISSTIYILRFEFKIIIYTDLLILDI